jgi:DNA polymerase
MNKEIIYQHIKNQCMINSWKKSVFGTGDLYSGFMFVGEAAGGDEERLGTPFVGKAGQILNESLSTVGLNRDSFYITT